MQRERLAELLDQLKQGNNVQNLQLRTWLGDEHWQIYESMQREQKELRADLMDKPVEVAEYERRLKRAVFADNKAEGNSARGKVAAARKARVKAEALFEGALVYLQEIIAADPSLYVWFDRDTAWTVDGDVGLDRHSMPKVVTSKGTENRGGGMLARKMTVRETKIYAIELALAAMAVGETLTGEDQAEKKRAMLSELLGREVKGRV